MSRQPNLSSIEKITKRDYDWHLMRHALTAVKSITSYRVIYGDTDQMGVVYYANYLRWFERGRAELLRRIGMPYQTIEQEGFNFPVAEVSCRYIHPARYDDLINIETELAGIRRAILVFNYRIVRSSDETLLAAGSTKHACVDRSGRLTRIPETLTLALTAGKRTEI
jgi:acyl-CoA thioester hydrolase